MRELELLQRGGQTTVAAPDVRELDEEDVEDLEEAPDEELQVVEEQILDQATAARTIAELRAEIETLNVAPELHVLRTTETLRFLGREQ